MKPQLLFLRHGVRGLFPPPDTPQQSPALPLFNTDKNLALYGHILSHDLGKSLRPDFIYADSTDERTIATGIAIAKGSGLNKLWLFAEFQEDPVVDPYFEFIDTPLTPEQLAERQAYLNSTQDKALQLKEVAESVFPGLILSPNSVMDEEGTLFGLLPQLESLASVYTFSKYSHIKISEKAKVLQKGYYLGQRASHTLSDLIINGTKYLQGMIELLKKHKRSIIIGHDTNITAMSEELKITYISPDNNSNFVPPDSGFRFTLHKKYVEVEFAFMNECGELSFQKAAKLPISQTVSVIPPLIVKRV